MSIWTGTGLTHGLIKHTAAMTYVYHDSANVTPIGTCTSNWQNHFPEFPSFSALLLLPTLCNKYRTVW